MLTASRLVYSILFFVLAMLILVVSRPSPLFDPSGQVRQFGLGGGDKTLCSLGVATVTIAVTSFYVFALIDMIFD